MGNGVGDPGDVGQDPSGQGLIEEDAEGKHIVIGVRNFNSAGFLEPQRQMLSYLRLGAAMTGAGDPTNRTMGEDLAGLVHGFTDDTRDRGTNDSTPVSPKEVLDPASPANDDTSTLDPRRKESKVLHSKGGWRDHSDGNRITTTRGDKVEVIRGNYKLVVLGRSDLDAANSKPTLAEKRDAREALLNDAAGFDLSGGQPDYSGDLSYGMIPEAGTDPETSPARSAAAAEVTAANDARDQTNLSVEYEWKKQDETDTWTWTQTTRMGSPAPAGPGAQANYRSLSYSYLDYQYTELHAHTIESETYADSISSTTTVTGENTSTQTADHTDTTTNSRWWTDLTSTDWIKEETVLTGLLMNEIDFAMNIGLLQIGTLTNTAVFFSPFITNINIGISTDVHVGPHIDLHPATHNELHTLMHTDTHLGIHLDNHLGTHVDFHIGSHVQMDIGDQVTINADQRLAIAPDGSMRVQDMAGDMVMNSTQVTQMTAAQATQIAGHHLLL